MAAKGIMNRLVLKPVLLTFPFPPDDLLKVNNLEIQLTYVGLPFPFNYSSVHKVKECQ